jgi:hypothetical protein
MPRQKVAAALIGSVIAVFAGASALARGRRRCRRPSRRRREAINANVVVLGHDGPASQSTRPRPPRSVVKQQVITSW